MIIIPKFNADINKSSIITASSTRKSSSPKNSPKNINSPKNSPRNNNTLSPKLNQNEEESSEFLKLANLKAPLILLEVF